MVTQTERIYEPLSSRRPSTQKKSPDSGGLSQDLIDLRQKHTKYVLGVGPNLSQEESLRFVLAGNDEHFRTLSRLEIKPRSRYDKIKGGEADYLVNACSDARIPHLDSEEDRFVGIFIRVAGNIVGRVGTPAFDEMRDALKLVKNDGALIVEGHSCCGALKAHNDWREIGSHSTGNSSLDNLLAMVEGDSPTLNALHQRSRADVQFPSLRPSAAVIYDWEAGLAGGITIVSHHPSPIIEILEANWNHRHKVAFEDGAMAARLQNHRPHVIAIGTSTLPYSLATIMHTEQNEVFSTTGSEKGLDALDEASILYGIQHLGIRHIAFVAPSEKSTGNMFSKWERDLRAMTVNGEHVIATMLDSGELKISCLGYDLDSGKLEMK